MDSAKHTATPWRVEHAQNLTVHCKDIFIGSETDTVGEVYQGHTRAEANAAYIIKAVNNFEDMLQLIKWYATGKGTADLDGSKARAILQRIEG